MTGTNRLLSVTLPSAFALDRQERDLPCGSGRWTTKGYSTDLDPETLADLLSDARHYADPGASDAPSGLRQSARATLRAITKASA